MIKKFLTALIAEKLSLEQTLIEITQKNTKPGFAQNDFQTFRHTNGEFVEAAHYTSRKRKLRHGFNVKRSAGSQANVSKSLKSFAWGNVLSVGCSPSTDLQLRAKRGFNPVTSIQLNFEE